jgi:arabinose-5-phosphate isomerase
MTNVNAKMDAAKAHDEHVEAGLKVLQTEINGLQALHDSLGGTFNEAVAVIHAMKQLEGTPGRLIIAGIGKSGHVARKLAATFASTGTPSYFVHPGEASHGDLGMITRNDVVLMLSNSGENAELSDLIHYTRRFDITLIGMTSRSESSLAKHSDIVLLLPTVPEACPNGMAPTTSTTMMMALGDAVAVALLEKMGLTKEDFQVFHPGGKLGQQLLKVSELMHGMDDLPLVTTDAKMDQALIVLTEKNLGCVLVVNDAKELQGIITDGDLKRHMGPDLLEKNVLDVMTKDPQSIQEKSLAAEAVGTMTRTEGRYLTSLIVNDAQNRLCGLIRLQDCLQAGVA